MAMPYLGKQYTFSQPDGTALYVRGWGNQHHAVFEALNGYTVLEDPTTGFYTYADVNEFGDDLVSTGIRPRTGRSHLLGIAQGARISDAAAKASAVSGGLPTGHTRWEIRRRELRETLLSARSGITGAPPKRATTGKYIGLCLLVQFPDVPGTVARDEVERFCNQPGYAGYGNNGSVYDYFLAVSGGKLSYTNIVTPYYTAKNPRSYYTNEAIAQPKRALELIKEALSYFKAKGFDFTGLSTDSSGYVYATSVFYAGTRVNNWSKGLWPHAYHLATPFELLPGKRAFDYQITDMTDALTLGTFCHENCHMVCDFPDLYDYGNESAGVGSFCLMCAGANVSETNPTHVGAYLKYRAGWATSAATIAPGIAVTFSGRANEFGIHRKSSTEYFILENRQNAGRDQGLPGSGLAIWHVDELGDNQFEEMTPQRHYECSLVQADNRFDLERDKYNIGDATDLFTASGNSRFGVSTAPRSHWWDGTPSGLEIHSISGVAPVITFQTS